MTSLVPVLYGTFSKFPVWMTLDVGSDPPQAADDVYSDAECRLSYLMPRLIGVQGPKPNTRHCQGYKLR